MSAVKKLGADAQRYANALIDVLRENGATEISVQMGGKHPRIVYLHGGIERFYAFPGTPSDSVRGIKNSVADIRRILGVNQQPIKRIGIRRVRRVQAAPIHSIPNCGPFSSVPDWHSLLLKHETVRPHLGAALDMAWLALWQSCMRRAGAVSLIGGTI